MSKKKRITARHVEIAAPAPPAPPTTGLSFFDRPWLPEIALALAAIVIFAPSVGNGFVFFDDDKAILLNETLQNPSFGRFFSGQNLGMYAPLTWIAYWLGSVLSGQEAWGYHAISLVLHALNTVLVFSFLRRLSERSWAAFFTALLFALHPVQVEAVSWAAALSTVLFSTFYLASLLAYLRWRLQKNGASPTPFWYGISLFAFTAACLAKSAAVTLPIVLVAVDFYLNKKQLGKFWLSKIPYFAIALIFGLYTFSTRAQEGHDIEAASAVFTAADRFFMVCQTILFYPVKLLVPLGFSISYPFVKMNGAWDWTYYAAPFAIFALAVLIWKQWRSRPDLLFGLSLYLLPLTVMLPFRTVGSFELRSDRYVYLSVAGLFFIAAMLLEKIKPMLRNTVMLVLAAVLGFLAFRQTEVWKDGDSLFRNCLEKTPESSLCQCNLAYNQLINYDFQGAVLHYSEALKYDPNTVEAYNGRGQAYFHLRQIPQALDDFNKAIEAGIVTPKIFLNRGKCLVMLNRPAEAIPDLTRSLGLDPNLFESYYFRAVAHEKTGDRENALKDYGSAIAVKPDYLEAFVNRGLLHANAQRYAEAISDYSRALEVNPNMEMIWNNRAYSYLQNGQVENALEDVNRALSINPNYAFAYQTRGTIFMRTGQTAQAQADLQKAQQLRQK